MVRASDSDDSPGRRERWQTACRVAALLAFEPHGLGGVRLRAAPGPARDRWLQLLRDLLPVERPIAKLHPGIGDDRLLGGLDLAATLAAGRPVMEPGLLARANGGLVVIPSAETLPAATAARIAAAMDRGWTELPGPGAGRTETRLGVVALDEGCDADAALPTALADRLAFDVDLSGLALADLTPPGIDAAGVAVAAPRRQQVTLPDATLAALCETAVAFGVTGPRACLLAAGAARAIAALAAREDVADSDAVEAVRLVLAPRATRQPTESEPDEEQAPPPPPEVDAQQTDADPRDTPPPSPHAATAEMMIEAMAAALPPGLLTGTAERQRDGTDGGRHGQRRPSHNRGRRIGSIVGLPRGGARLDILATLRAAAPWQRLRVAPPSPAPGRPLAIRRQDFRVQRFEEPGETLTVFVVDASGSAAMNRLGEAKGAVELLLADCYVRRDRVALIAFRATRSDIVLPPTRALARAKRCLAGLPGGGGTPLASAIVAARQLAEYGRRRGQTATVVLLTDCRPNVTIDGRGGRPQAETDALLAARGLAAQRHRCLLIDTSPRPQPFARELAAALAARHLPLPFSDSRTIAQATRELARDAGPQARS